MLYETVSDDKKYSAVPGSVPYVNPCIITRLTIHIIGCHDGRNSLCEVCQIPYQELFLLGVHYDCSNFLSQQFSQRLMNLSI